MKKACWPALAGLFVWLGHSAAAFTFTETFAANPSADGWQAFGDTNLFVWDSTNRDLAVTWDSAQTNSYFFHALDFPVTAHDDFSVEFDLTLGDIASGSEPGKTGPMELGFEFMDLAAATSPAFQRNNYGGTPNIAGFDYYTDGYLEYGGVDYPAAPAAVPTFVSGTDSYDYAPQKVAPYDAVLPLHQTAHVKLGYTAADQTAQLTITTNGVPMGPLPPLALNGPNGFLDADYDFSVDAFCIASFSSYEDDYDSVLAHGTISNLVVNVPPPAQNLAGVFTNGTWQVQFSNHLGWLYTLQRTTDFITWEDVSAAAGNGTSLVLSDAGAPAAGAFYRISAARP